MRVPKKKIKIKIKQHYIFSKNFFKKQKKEILEDWGRKLTVIYETITNDEMISIDGMTKNELVDFCYFIVDEIFDYEVNESSFFFWRDGGYDGVNEYLYETINEYEKGNNNDLINDFIDSKYCKVIFEIEIKKYKRDKIYRELLNDDIDTSFGTLQEQIIGRWETYKLGHSGGNELFDGNVGDPFV